MSARRIVLEADGGSRGNPGPASYGALIRDASTGQVIAERGETIGIASNNVAEYSGLIAGLELAREHAPDAEIEVRMDSKLVVEQMAGRWKIKHEAMRALALQARRIAGPVTDWVWVPRERNKAADALANEALDLQARTGRPALVGTGHRDAPAAPEPAADVTAEAAAPAGATAAKNPLLGWRGRQHGDPTRLVLVRHGVTASTVQKLFCGSGGSDPGLTPDGEAQAVRAATWVQRHVEADVVLASPLRRTQETAGFVARELGLDVAIEPGLAEAAFGDWDGHGFADIMRRWPDELSAWLSDTSVAPPGGESFDAVSARVEAAHARILAEHGGRTVVAVGHVTPIKMLVRLALDAPMDVIHKMELAPASITTISWWPDGVASLQGFSIVPD